MRLYDRAADRETHAHPLRLGRIESVEEMLQIFCTQPRTRILYRDKYPLRFIRAGSNQQLAYIRAGSTHRLDRVHHQIENDLLQLDPVCQNDRHIIGELRL